MNIFFSSPPENALEAAKRGSVSLMAYRMGAGFHLYRTALPRTRFRLMDVDCAGFTGYGPHELLALEFLRECRTRGYEGVCLGLPGRPTEPLIRFCGVLGGALEREGRTLYLPKPYAAACNSARLLIPAGTIRGPFASGLGALCREVGPERVALELERVCTDYVLPVKSGLGAVLSRERLRDLTRRSRIFYSPELVSRYASFRKDGRVHLALWDDEETLREKLRTAASLGIHASFLYYPHIRDTSL